MAKSLLDKRLSTNVKQNSPSKTKTNTAKPKKEKTENLLSSRLSNNHTIVKDDSLSQIETDENIYSNVADNKVSKEKSSFFKKKKEKAPDVINSRNISVDDILDKELDIKQEKEVSKYKTHEAMGFVKKIAVVIGCIYFCILIYGVMVTEYTYDETGNPVALAMSYSDLKLLDEYETLIEQYYEMQNLYAKMLDIDYKYYLNPNNSIALSAEYEGLLEDVSKVSIKTESISVPTAYTQIRSMMLSWIKNDIAVYLQNMSAAITQNNPEKANNAAQDRTRLQNNYTIISNNLIAFGEQIKGMDVNDLVEWTPEKHNEKLVNKGAE